MPLSKQDIDTADNTVTVLYTLIEGGDYEDAQTALNNFIKYVLKSINEEKDPKELVSYFIFQLDEQKKDKKRFPTVGGLGAVQLKAAKALGAVPPQILDCFTAITPNVMASASAMFTGAKMAPEERTEKLLEVLLRGTPAELQKDTKETKPRKSIFGKKS